MKKIFKYLLLILISISFTVIKVNAKGYIKDLFRAGDEVTVKDPVDGTSFIAGNNIKINNKIDGIGFIAGNNIKVNSEQEYLFVAGNDIVLTKDINKDLFVVGANIEIKEINIKRDAYVAGGNVDINGNVNRNIYIYGENVTLKGIYNGNITIASGKISIDDDTVINGTLKYNEDAIITGLKESIKTKTYKNVDKKITIKEMIINYISSYLHIVILGLALVFVFEKLFNKINKESEKLEIKDVFVNSGKGLLMLIGTPIIALMLLLSGLFLSIGVIITALYCILIYISTIISGYILLSILDKKIFNKNMNNYLLVIIGVLIIYILKIIPIVGGFISFISLIFGLGILGNKMLELRK